MKTKGCDKCINYIEVSMLELRLRNRIEELEAENEALQKEKERVAERRQKDSEQLRNALRNLLSRVANDADAHAWWMSEQEEAIKALGAAMDKAMRSE